MEDWHIIPKKKAQEFGWQSGWIIRFTKEAALYNVCAIVGELESCGARFLAPRPRSAPLFFTPTRTGPKNSKFHGPDPWTDPIIFSPDRTGPKQFSINPKLTSFDPDRPENSEVWKLCWEFEIKYLRGVEWVHGLFLFPLVLGKM